MEATPTVVQPRMSSAVMLLRPAPLARGQDVPSGQGIEVFMVRRVIQSDFMPDVYVFPGGSVSADDRAAELVEDVCTPVAPTAADPEGRTVLGSGVRAAAIRELFEEAILTSTSSSPTGTWAMRYLLPNTLVPGMTRFICTEVCCHGLVHTPLI